MTDIKELEILNDSHENRKLLQKLPDWIVTRWSRIVVNHKKTCGTYPPFANFVQFIATEAEIACDPVTSLGAIRPFSEKEKDKVPNPRKRTMGAKTLATEGQAIEGQATEGQEKDEKMKSAKPSCKLCRRDSHTLHDCRTFTRKPSAEKQEFIRKNGLCFGCLGYGHLSKNCKQKSVCKRCDKKHPTCLHEEQRFPSGKEKETKETEKKKEAENKSESREALAICCGALNDGKEPISSMIVPVWLSSRDKPDNARLVYALLDTQSDTTFMATHTGKKLETPSEPVRLKLSTMTAKDKTISCDKYKDLTVRGYDSNIRIPLPTVYTRQFIPVDESHIPTPDTAKTWPHLKGIAHRIHPLQDCEIGLLIRYNCPQALAPRNCITGEGNQPFAVETDLGWSIVGKTDHDEDDSDFLGVSHRIVTKEVPESLLMLNYGAHISQEAKEAPTRVQYVCTTSIRE